MWWRATSMRRALAIFVLAVNAWSLLVPLALAASVDSTPACAAETVNITVCRRCPARQCLLTPAQSFALSPRSALTILRLQGLASWRQWRYQPRRPCMLRPSFSFRGLSPHGLSLTPPDQSLPRSSRLAPTPSNLHREVLEVHLGLCRSTRCGRESNGTTKACLVRFGDSVHTLSRGVWCARLCATSCSPLRT